VLMPCNKMLRANDRKGEIGTLCAHAVTQTMIQGIEKIEQATDTTNAEPADQHPLTPHQQRSPWHQRHTGRADDTEQHRADITDCP